MSNNNKKQQEKNQSQFDRKFMPLFLFIYFFSFRKPTKNTQIHENINIYLLIQMCFGFGREKKNGN